MGLLNVGKSYIYSRNDTSGLFVKVYDEDLSPSIYSNTLLPNDIRLSMNEEGGFIFQPYSFSQSYPSRYYFFESDLIWKSTEILIPMNVSDNDRYGYSVAISTSNQYLSISALSRGINPSSGFPEGVVYFYEFNDTINQFEEKYPIYGDTGEFH